MYSVMRSTPTLSMAEPSCDWPWEADHAEERTDLNRLIIWER